MLSPFTGLPPTEKLYHHDQYATSCTATVLASDGERVVFDRTIFYAESGGQVADQGWVDGRRVVDVQKSGGDPYPLPSGDFLRVNTRFVHHFDAPPGLAVGQRVSMEVDWERRYRNMQMHTLAHFLFHASTEYLASVDRHPTTRGCYISDDSARFDFHAAIEPDAVPVIEKHVRELVATGAEATVTPFPDADDVFLWSCAGIEIPCGGTHVRSATEILGEVSVRRRSKGKQGTRLYVTLTRP